MQGRASTHMRPSRCKWQKRCVPRNRTLQSSQVPSPGSTAASRLASPRPSWQQAPWSSWTRSRSTPMPITRISRMLPLRACGRPCTTTLLIPLSFRARMVRPPPVAYMGLWPITTGPSAHRQNGPLVGCLVMQDIAYLPVYSPWWICAMTRRKTPKGSSWWIARVPSSYGPS